MAPSRVKRELNLQIGNSKKGGSQGDGNGRNVDWRIAETKYPRWVGWELKET